MIYVVTGMHKSGTTVVSALLHQSGVNMVEAAEEEIGYDQGNKYERLETLHINNSLLRSHGRNSIEIDMTVSVTPQIRQEMQGLVADCSERHKNWGFKDPRTSVTYPQWRDVLPEHKVILIFRDPNESWRRYTSNSVVGLAKRPLRAWKFLQTWCAYNENMMQVMAASGTPFEVLDYHELMTDCEELDRISQYLGTSVTDVRDRSMYRSRGGYSFALAAVDRMRALTGKGSYRSTLKALKAIRNSQVLGVESQSSRQVSAHELAQ